MSTFGSTQLTDDEPAAPGYESPGQFKTGVRSGLHGALSQLQAAAGGIGEAVGATDFATSAYEASRGQQAEAQRYAPRVTDFREIKGVRDFYDFTTGIMGQSLPVSAAAVGAGMLGGPGAGAATARAGLATMPFNVGDVIQRQQSDPVSMQASPGSRLTDAALGGGAASIVEGIVPGAVAGKLMARGAAPTLRSIPGDMAKNIAIESAAETAGEAAKQGAVMLSSPDRAFDTGALADAAVGGAVGGAPLAAVGGAADAVRATANAPGKMFAGAAELAGRAKAAVTEKVGDLRTSTQEQAPVAFDSAFDDIGAAFKKAGDTGREWWGAVKEGRDTLGIGKKAGEISDAASQALADSDRAQKVKGAFDEMMGDATLPQGLRAGLSGITDLADRGQQAAVATAREAWSKAKGFKDVTGKFFADVQAKREALKAAASGAKKSEDYSGLRASILDQVMPVLRERGILTDDTDADTINQTAENLRYLIDKTANGDDFEGGDIAFVREAFGDEHFIPIMKAAYRAVYGSGDAAKTQAFFGALNEVSAASDSNAAFVSMLRKNMAPEAERSYGDVDLSRLADKLTDWARGYRGETETNQEKRFNDNDVVLKNLRATFGSNADSVLEALQKRAKANKSSMSDPEGLAERAGSTTTTDYDDDGKPVHRTDLDARGGDTLVEREGSNKYEAHYYGEGPDKTSLVTREKFDRVDKDFPETSPLAKAKAAHPDKQVAFLTAKELGADHRAVMTMQNKLAEDAIDKFEGDTEAAAAWAAKEVQKYGMVVAEGDKVEGSINGRDIKRMALVQKDGDSYSSASRVEVDIGNEKPLLLDAIKISSVARNTRAGYDEGNAWSRAARDFASGLAGVMTHLGVSADKIKLPSGTVIAYIGNKPFTYDDAQKLDLRSAEDKATDQMKADLESLKLQLGYAREASEQNLEYELVQEIRQLENKLEFAQAKDVVDLDESGSAVQVFQAKRDREGKIIHSKDGAVSKDRKKPTTTVGRKRGERDFYDSEGNVTKEGESFRLTGTETASGFDTNPEVTQAKSVLRGAHGFNPERRARLTQLRTQYAAIFAKSNVTPNDRDRAASMRAEGEKLGVLERQANEGEGRSEIDPFWDNIHLAARNSEGGEPVYQTNMDGSARAPLSAAKPGPYAALLTKFEGLQETGTAVQKAIAVRGQQVVMNADRLDAAGKKALRSISDVKTEKKLSEVANVVNELHARLKLKELNPAKDQPASDRPARIAARIDKVVGDQNFAGIETDAQGTAFLTEAAKRLVALTAAKGGGNLSGPEQVAYNKLSKMFREGKAQSDFGSFMPESKGDDADVRSAIYQAVPEVAAIARPKGGKKFSLLSTEVHEDLGRAGFAATHDSPVKHEGKFNWREHKGKGEGNASFGAGTYLSTANGVHKSYKGQFSARTESAQFVNELSDSDDVRDLLKVIASEMRDMKSSAADIKEYVVDELLGNAREYAEGSSEKEAYMGAHFEAKKRDESFFELGYGTPSPTYEVSVGIDQDQLLDWDKPLNEQSSDVQEKVKALLAAAGNDMTVRVMNNNIKLREWGNTTGERIYRLLQNLNGSQEAASDALQDAGILGHRYAAGGGRNDKFPNYVVYDDSKIETNYVHMSAQTTSPGASATAKSRKAVEKFIEDVIGPQVKVEFANFGHAGEYERVSGTDFVRVSVHALRPMSVAYHESLHALFAKLMDQGNTKLGNVLMDVAMSEHVQAQLRVHLKGEKDALLQLRDPEEAAAYMFQFWMDGKLTIGPAPTTIFQKIKKIIQDALGIWSEDKRAEEIMDYFARGEFAKNLNNPSAVHDALMMAGRNGKIDALAKLTEPVTNFGERLMSPAAERMREAGIPALRQIANMVKAERTASADDPGYLPASRYKYALYMNKLATQLQAFTKVQLEEGLEVMQDRTKYAGASTEAKAISDLVQGPQGMLPTIYGYMKKAGVDVSKYQTRPDYFPRVYDTDYISRHKADFVKVLEKNGVATKDANELAQRMIANEGREFTVEVMKPGNQFTKERKLHDIPDAELAKFMDKDPFKILSGYIMQATRQAEWVRRFGADNDVADRLLAQAKTQGASKDDLEMADNFVKAVNGTLGDGLNPNLRRAMGNAVVYQNIRLLPLVIFSNIVDPMGIVVRGGQVTDAFAAWRQAGKEIVRTFRKTYQADAETKLAEQMGTIDNAVLTHEMASMYTQGMVGDGARKINDLFFRYNLSEGMNRAMRVAATQAAISFIERHADGTASPHSTRFLAELGLAPGDVTSKIDATAHPKIKAAVNRWVDGAVLRPDAADRALWMSDPHFMLISHLKQFVFAFQETILKRVAHEYRHGNFAPAMALASYVPIMIAADMMKHLLQGGGELPEWKKGWGLPEYVGAGMERAGLFGVRQMGVDALQDLTKGEVWMGSLSGPAVDQMFTGLSVIGGRADGGKWLLDALPANDVYEGAVR